MYTSFTRNVFLLLFMLVRTWAARAPLSRDKVKEIRQEINKLIVSNAENGQHPFIAGFVRLSFHDCVGNCDGCVNLANPDNAGLGRYITPLTTLYNEKGYKTVLSHADFWSLASIEAIAMASEYAGKRLDVPFRWGREDCDTPPKSKAANIYPSAHGDTDHVIGYFSKEFGLSHRETVALLGAHTLGRTSAKNSGFDGPWVVGVDVLDNQYYKDMLKENWTQVNIRASTPSQEQRWQWERKDSKTTFMMLNADMALVKNITVSTSGESTCKRSFACPNLPADTYRHVVEYANDNDIWMKDFANAFLKMIENARPGVYLALKEPIIEVKDKCNSSSTSKKVSSILSILLMLFLNHAL